MTEPLLYRHRVDERHVDGTWVTQTCREMTEAEAEGLNSLLYAVSRGLDSGRISLECGARLCADLLDINYEVYRDLPPNERMALLTAQSGDNAEFTH